MKNTKGELGLLERRIKEKAEERFNKEFEKFTESISSTDIGRRLAILVTNKEKHSLVHCNGTTGGTFFNRRFEDCTDYGKNLTNIFQIKEELLKKYEQQEAGDLLHNLELLKGYIN